MIRLIEEDEENKKVANKRKQYRKLLTEMQAYQDLLGMNDLFNEPMADEMLVIQDNSAEDECQVMSNIEDDGELVNTLLRIDEIITDIINS